MPFEAASSFHRRAPLANNSESTNPGMINGEFRDGCLRKSRGILDLFFASAARVLGGALAEPEVR